MKIRAWLGLFVASAAVVSATENDALLLKADAMQSTSSGIVASGNARAISGSTNVSADRIALDKATGQLRFSGNIKIQVNGQTLAASELVLETKGKRLFTLATGVVDVATPSMTVVPETPESSKGTRAVPLFQSYEPVAPKR
jgi:lipopolysaccharide assembly outer membrane protein LptD (OstA)